MRRTFGLLLSGRVSSLLRYGVAAACATAGLLTARLAEHAFGTVIFSIPVAATALLSLILGAGPAALAALMTGVGYWYYMKPPESFAPTSKTDVARLVAYFMASAVVVATARLLHRTRHRLSDVAVQQRETSDRLRALSEAIPQLVFVATSDGTAEYVNARWTEYTGLQLEDVNRRGWASTIHPEDLELASRRWDECLATESATQIELRYRARDGSYRWFVVSMAPLAREHDRVVRWMGTATDIHQRKEADRRVHRLLEGSPMGTLVGDQSGHILFANDAYLRLTGGSREDLLRGEMRWDGHTTPEELERDRHAIRQALDLGASGVYERHYERSDGISVPILVAWASLGNGELAAFTVDITERKRAEEALRTSERLARERMAELEAVYDTAPVGLCVLDEQLRWVRVNRVLADMIGRTIEEHLGKTPRELIPELGPEAEEGLRAVLRTGRRVDTEWSGRSPVQPRSVRTWSEHWVPIKDTDGRVVGVSVAAEDITERKRSESELANAKARLEVILAYLPAGVLIADAGGRITDSNERARTIWASDAPLPHEDLAFRGYSPESHKQLRPDEWPLARAVSHGETVVGELIDILRFDGSCGTILCNAAPFRDNTGRITGAVVVILDVTEARRAERALRDADRRKTEFLAMLSHELRNPLAPIKNSLYVLERATPGGQQAKRAEEVIDRQVMHLTRLIDDLLDVTRVSRGKTRLQRERLDLVELVRRTAEDHRPMFADAGVTMTVNTGQSPIFASADPVRVAQIVGNLLSNAAKFTPPGGHVELSLAREDGVAAIHVKDSGAGISPELMDTLWEPFVQGDATLDRSKGGLGLGLALVKSLAELHGGTVTARSAGQGNGAEFSVRLPVEPAGNQHREAVRPRPAPAVRLKVLIVEDNADAASSLKEVLELDDHEVRVAFNGPDGITAARELKPDVVLCDIGLPSIDGYGVARALRGDPDLKDVFLVALSGYASQEDVQRSKAAGFDRHMAKPPDIAALEATLAEAPRAPAAAS